MNLPAGSAVWGSTGGPLSWAAADYWASHMFHAMNIANWQRTKAGREGKNAPKLVDPPEYTHIQKRKQDRASKKAERYLAMQQQRETGISAYRGRAEREPVKQPPE